MATIKALFQNYDYVLNSEQKMYIQMAREEVFTPFGHSVMLFWDKYSSRFCNHLDRRLVISFIVHSRTENPLFEMKGRTYKSVLRHAQEWEAEREHTRTVQKKSNIKVWKGANYQDFKKDFALGGKKGRKITYTITQITDSVELREEGYQMQHCVGSYLDKCMEGYCSIWSLRQTEKGGIVSTLVTIEVSASRRIVQARTSYNAIPSDNHQAFIKEWAKNANLICDFEF